MNKKKNIKLQKRDLVTLLLFVAIIGSNLMWYYIYQNTRKIMEIQGWNDYQIMVQNSKLHLCFEQNTRPCDVTPPEVPNHSQ